MTKKHDKPLHLDMSFDEALKRFAQTDPRQIPKEKKTKARKSKQAQSESTSKSSASRKRPKDTRTQSP
jgi:hypothetical protein